MRPVQITRTVDGKVASIRWESTTYKKPGGIIGGLFNVGIPTQHAEYSVEWDGRKPTLAQLFARGMFQTLSST